MPAELTPSTKASHKTNQEFLNKSFTALINPYWLSSDRIAKSVENFPAEILALINKIN